MDFVDWCSHVLWSLIEANKTPEAVHRDGVIEIELAQSLYGQQVADDPQYQAFKRLRMLAAMWRLVEVGLADCPGKLSPNPQVFVRVTRDGLSFADDLTPIWESICSMQLMPEEEDLLRAVNRLSHHDDVPPWIEGVHQGVVATELGWKDGEARVLQVARRLHELGLVFRQDFPGPGFSLQANLSATYRGLVWETRRGFTLESKFIDHLAEEWETTSVEFKRELHTNTADEKAEVVKDLIGLANTQASGRRWLIVGFDDKTRGYHGPPDPKITQNHLEQILSQFTAPVVDVRYQVISYRLGFIGKLEILRDPKKLPHCVAKSVGGKKRITQGQTFVRHGSQTEEPTPAELKALQEEADRARGDGRPNRFRSDSSTDR